MQVSNNTYNPLTFKNAFVSSTISSNLLLLVSSRFNISSSSAVVPSTNGSVLLNLIIYSLVVTLSLAVTNILIVFSPSTSASAPVTLTTLPSTLGYAIIFKDSKARSAKVYSNISGANTGFNSIFSTIKVLRKASELAGSSAFVMLIVYTLLLPFSAVTVILTSLFPIIKSLPPTTFTVALE